MKILVTIGSMSERKFTRLFKIIDELCAEGFLNGRDITAQVGFDQYHSEYYQCFDMVSDEQFKQFIDQSDLIISHAGTGTVTSCIKKGKKVIIFPRLEKYQEHYDDHQMDLTTLFVTQGYVRSAINKEELRKEIAEIDYFHPTPFISNNARMNQIVIRFIEGEAK